MDAAMKKALQEGLADALGFVLGALAGWHLGQAFGLDFIASKAWGMPEMISLALILAGSGAGRWLCRQALAQWQAKQQQQQKKP